MGNVFRAQPPESTLLVSSAVDARGLGCFNLTRDRSIKKFCRPPDSRNFGSHDLLAGFLAAAKRDGYITDEEYKELARAVDDVNDHVKPNSLLNRAALHQQETMAALMVPGMGFSNEQNARGHRGPKKRGSFQDVSPSVSRLLGSVVDAEAVLHDREFNCRSRGNIQEDCLVIVHGFTQPWNYLGRFQMDCDKLNSWLQAIGEQYARGVAYHNWMHALDVFQLCFLAITDGELTEYLNHQDKISIFIAAIAHDVGHTGTNNAFQIKTRTRLANMYNDRSPMENMHASLTFETLRHSGANFLEQMPSEDFDNVRMKIVDTILETDPSKHFEFVEELSSRFQQANKFLKKSDVPDGDDKTQEQYKTDRRLLLRGVVHMWDIGNAFRPWDVYRHLVASLEEEFYTQGDRERELGVPIAPMMDREKDSLAGGQGFFIGMLVLPLFNLYGQLMKEELVRQFRETLDDNKKRWHDLVQKHGNKPASVLVSLEG